MVKIAAAMSFICVSLIPSRVFAQSQGQRYVVGGLATTEAWSPYVSGGGELLSSAGLSIGADGGVLFGRTGFRPRYPKGQTYRQYALSLIAGAHALHGFGQAFEPFVLGGVSLLTDPDCCGPVMGWNVGGGANYWLKSRIGFRIDGRLIRQFGGEGGMVTAQAGITFR